MTAQTALIAWEWDSAANGTVLGGLITCLDRLLVRERIEREMQRAGARSALAQQVVQDVWGNYEPTGNAMIAMRPPEAGAITWRDVHDTATAPHKGCSAGTGPTAIPCRQRRRPGS